MNEALLKESSLKSCIKNVVKINVVELIFALRRVCLVSSKTQINFERITRSGDE